MTLSKPRGFAIAAWAEDGLAFAAISDVDPQELTRFAELVRSTFPDASRFADGVIPSRAAARHQPVIVRGHRGGTSFSADPSPTPCASPDCRQPLSLRAPECVANWNAARAAVERLAPT